MSKKTLAAYKSKLKGLENARAERQRKADSRRLNAFVQAAAPKPAPEAAPRFNPPDHISVLTQCFDNMREEIDRARRNGDFWRRMAFDLLTRSPLESDTWLKGRTAASAQATNFFQNQTPTQ